MKKIIVLLLISLGSLTGSAQIKNYFFTDTTAANTSPTKMYRVPGAQIVTRSDNKLWIRNFTRTAWVEVGGSAEAPTPPGLQDVLTAGQTANGRNINLVGTNQAIVIYRQESGNKNIAGMFDNAGKAVYFFGQSSPEYVATLSFSSLSGSRSWTLPDKSGIIAMTTDNQNGTYAPTFSLQTNVASSSSVTGVHYTAVGDVVTVYYDITVTSTAGASTATQISLSLPYAIASSYITGEAAAFSAFAALPGNQTLPVITILNSGIARLRWMETDAVARRVTGSFSYMK